MLWIALLTSAAHAEPGVAEEIIVWQQPFARFDDKRWVVRSEVITPALTPLGTVKTPVNATAWQLETLIHCNLADNSGSLREAHCRVVDAAVRVHVPGRKPDGKAELAIEAMAAAMVGKNVQLQVNRRGRVPNLDVDGLEEDNVDERRIVTGVHTMMSQVSAAFHMDFPKADPRGASWVSYKDPLLMLASPRAGMSSSEVMHRIDVVDGKWVQQTTGRSVSTSPVPNPDAGLPCFENFVSKYGQCLKGEQRLPDYLGIEMTYALDLSGVSVVDPDLGYPVERIWSVNGSPTASSPGTLGTGDYWAAGVLRELGEDEDAELGATGLIAAPRTVMEGLPPWVSVAHIPE